MLEFFQIFKEILLQTKSRALLIVSWFIGMPKINNQYIIKTDYELNWHNLFSLETSKVGQFALLI